MPITAPDVATYANECYDRFNAYAGDLHPAGTYSRKRCEEIAVVTFRIRELLGKKNAQLFAHSYQRPEIHEAADVVSDSLRLAKEAEARKLERIYYSSVYFMAATGIAMLQGRTRFFVPHEPDKISCSLVQGTDHAYLERYKQKNPGAVFVTYINSDMVTKAMSEYICTSGNASKVITRAARENPGQRILVLPDQFLGEIMKLRSVTEDGVDGGLIDVYSQKFGGRNACCYVHEKFDITDAERQVQEDPDTVIYLHPECGCANFCRMRVSQGYLPEDRVFYFSTEGMLDAARKSSAKTFIIGTETGMIYRLRQMLPGKDFRPISVDATCDFMKAISIEDVLASIEKDRYELVLNPLADPKNELRILNKIHINSQVAEKARIAIERMLSTPAG